MNLNDAGRPADLLRDAANQLKECQPLVDRLKAFGVTIQLTSLEINNLQTYEKLVLTNLSDR